jgi:hypothetical protein
MNGKASLCRLFILRSLENPNSFRSSMIWFMPCFHNERRKMKGEKRKLICYFFALRLSPFAFRPSPFS